MSESTSNAPDITALLRTLGDKDGLKRQHAREALVAIGESVAPPLMELLQDSDSEQIRWEAAKALGALKAPQSIPTLVKALADEDSDVAWLAAEGLKRFKKAAWPALLTALIDGTPKSGALYQGAHHVLVNQKESDFDDLLPALVQELAQGELSEAVIVTAHEILDRLKRES